MLDNGEETNENVYIPKHDFNISSANTDARFEKITERSRSCESYE